MKLEENCEEPIKCQGTKYPRIFLKSNGDCWVYYPSNIFCNTADLLKIGENHLIFPSLT